MTKPTRAQQKRFEAAVSKLAVSISELGDVVVATSMSSEAVMRAFGHLAQTLERAQQRCLFAAQTNDAGSFSLDGPAPVTLAIPIPNGFTPEGRLVGTKSEAPPAVSVETDADGEGMLMVP